MKDIPAPTRKLLGRFSLKEPLIATRYIRKMHGGSQACLVECNDSQHYVVKMPGNPQGLNVLANEVMGSILLGAIGLPVPPMAAIMISASFLARENDMCFEAENGRKGIQPGLAFGSGVVGAISGPGRAMEYLSMANSSRVINDVFVGMGLLDIWANHQDRRQALFVVGVADHLLPVFIDHGAMFGGAAWNFEEDKCRVPHRERSLYSGMWNGTHRGAWLKRMERCLPDALAIATSAVPKAWFHGDIEQLEHTLRKRLVLLPALVDLHLQAEVD